MFFSAFLASAQLFFIFLIFIMVKPQRRTALIAVSVCVVLFIYVTIKGPSDTYIEDVPDDVDPGSYHANHCSRKTDIEATFKELRIPQGTHGQGGGTGTPNSLVCIFSLLTDIDYTPLAQVLGYSMIKEKSKGIRVMLIPKKLERGDIQEDLESTGWIPVVVEPIYKHKAQEKNEELLNTFMKVHMWAFTECKSIIYVDVSSLATKNFDELHDLFKSTEIYNFAATLDQKSKKIDTAVLVLKPNLDEYHKLLKSMCDSKVKYNKALAFDGFISHHYSEPMLNLPAKYNADSDIWSKRTEDWKEQQKVVKIIHYNKDKPGVYGDLSGDVFDVWYYARNDMIEYLETHHTHE